MGKVSVERPFMFVLLAVVLGPLFALVFCSALFAVYGAVTGVTRVGDVVPRDLNALLPGLVFAYWMGTLPALLSGLLIVIVDRVWRPARIISIQIVCTLLSLAASIVFVRMLGGSSPQWAGGWGFFAVIALSGALAAATYGALCRFAGVVSVD